MPRKIYPWIFAKASSCNAILIKNYFHNYMRLASIVAILPLFIELESIFSLIKDSESCNCPFKTQVDCCFRIDALLWASSSYTTASFGTASSSITFDQSS
jgi:hypothetical protein